MRNISTEEVTVLSYLTNMKILKSYYFFDITGKHVTFSIYPTTKINLRVRIVIKI